jgi:hypothetical protein
MQNEHRNCQPDGTKNQDQDKPLIHAPTEVSLLPNAGNLQQQSMIVLVPGERIELPTFGLQYRCSTAELPRLTGIFVARGCDE